MSTRGRYGRGWVGGRPLVGVLHPGRMGAALGSALKPVASAVVWAAEGRSQTTSKRAELADLVAVPDVAAVARRCDLIISCCPPAAALDVAAQVAAGLADRVTAPPVYLDVNDIDPQTTRQVAAILGAAAHFVDGTVLGPPAWQRGGTELLLTGAAAADIAELFRTSPFVTRVTARDDC